MTYCTVIPEDNKINVFSNGKCKGFNTLIPNGGQTDQALC
jgi:hypothetical protein